jgi:hypothetical protein
MLSEPPQLKGIIMSKNQVRGIVFALLLSVTVSFASTGLEESSGGDGYFAFSSGVVSLVISDESGYTGVLLTKQGDPTTRVWLWSLSDSRTTPEGYKGILGIALSAMSQGSIVSAIAVSAPPHSFMDTKAKGNRIASYRITQLWAEAP